MPQPRNRRPVAVWLLAGCLLMAAMITAGGVTRLTGSGLSITEWNVLMGAIPPLSDRDWQELFAKYQATPQYQLQNTHFTLAEFKGIFWWEYLHRLLGRFLGVAFFVPFLVFLIRGYLPRGLRGRVLLILGLGAFQGALGWFMVASGLVDQPSVSHYRLAAHLLVAFFTLGFTLWVALGVLAEAHEGVRVPEALRRQVLLFTGLFVLQAAYGAFVAGLRAGFVFNTFPLMGGGLTPPGLFLLEPVVRNLTENPIMVQYLHRLLAWALVAFGLWLWYSLRLHGVGWVANAFLAALILQFGLGALTVLRLPVNPVFWGAVHQAGAVLLLAALVVLLFSIRRPARARARAPAPSAAAQAA